MSNELKNGTITETMRNCRIFNSEDIEAVGGYCSGKIRGDGSLSTRCDSCDSHYSYHTKLCVNKEIANEKEEHYDAVACEICIKSDVCSKKEAYQKEIESIVLPDDLQLVDILICCRHLYTEETKEDMESRFHA